MKPKPQKFNSFKDLAKLKKFGFMALMDEAGPGLMGQVNNAGDYKPITTEDLKKYVNEQNSKS